MESPASQVAAPRAAAGRVAAGVAEALFYLAYPFVIYLAYTRLGTRGLGALLLGLYGFSLVLRLRGSAAELWQVVRPHLGLALGIGVAIAVDDRRLLQLLPMLVSLYMLSIFATSLWRGPPMIERFARVVEDDLPDFTLPYCRRVTAVWCVFLGLNSACIGVLALAAPLAWWAVYTGFLFYLLLALLLGVEFLVRKLWFRYYTGGLADRVLARLFPPERTANGRRSLAYMERRRVRAAARA
jgi:uncharacterized membrane protein